MGKWATQGNFGFRTLVEFDERNPIRNLWRNVLVAAISDAIKIKSTTLKFSKFYSGKKFYEVDYVTLPNRDFDAVCQLSELDGNLVRKKINKVMKEMEDNYGKGNMPKMPWKRLYQSEGIHRESDGNHTSMSAM
jgi:hypothetical protein